MHELTLLYGVVDKVEKVCRENNLDRVDAVVIEVGEATSVIPEFLQDGYEVISDDYDFLRGSELIIERIKAIGLCRRCGKGIPERHEGRRFEGNGSHLRRGKLCGTL